MIVGKELEHMTEDYLNKKKVKLNIITSYHNRPKNRELFFDSVVKLPRHLDLNFIFENWDEEGTFSTGKLHNRSVARVPDNEWILKQDVDCVGNEDFYTRLLKHLEDKPDDFFMNIGVIGYNFVDKNKNYPQGNQWLMKKKLYQDAGGEPEWVGYGFEDYALLYRVTKHLDKNFKLDYNESNVSNVIRDQLARPLNQKNPEFFLYHNDHPYEGDFYKYAKENRKNLYNLCRGLDEKISSGK
jgi:hypothetical protein